MELAILLALTGSVGVLIGAFSIGGVLLAPGLIHLLQVEPRVAVAACMVCYLFSGAVGSHAYLKKLSIDRHEALALAGGAVPGAFLGSMMLGTVPVVAIELAIALLLLLSGLWVLFGSAVSERTVQRRSAGQHMTQHAMLGLLTGVISAITGTGGPVTLVPLLLAVGRPAIAAIGLGQVIQIPIAAAATAGNLLAGGTAAGESARLVWTMLVPMCVAISVGTLIGVRVAHFVPSSQLRRLLSGLILLLGVGLLIELAARVIGG